ncbi:MAG TPA: hypothetical protein VIB07_01420 [Nitrososphaera sp.]|jgi:hypothetical protein
MHRYTKEALVAAFLLLLPVAAVSAYAQGMPEVVSGTYINAEAGVEITFPDGWSGFEVSQTSETTLVATSPGGLSESDPETMSTITLLITAKGGRDARDPDSLTQEVIDCNPPSITSRTVAGVLGNEITVECPSSNQKSRMVTLETADNIVAVMFMSPAAEFDSKVGAFDSAVNSLSVEGATSSGGTGGGALIELTSITRTVVIAEANVNVSIRSNSTIGPLELDADNKRVSFTAEGETGTRGTTEIEIGKVLEGPYTVTIDGQVTTDFEVANEGSVDAVMTISYGHSEREVTITGTQVVPEFPVVALGAVAAAIGAVTILGRTRLFKR